MDSMVRKCLVVGYDVSGKDIATDASTGRLDTTQGTEVLQRKIKTPFTEESTESAESTKNANSADIASDF